MLGNPTDKFSRRGSVGGVTTTISQLSVGPMDNNVYLVSDSAGRTLLIDAANDAEEVLAAAREAGGVELIVTTHRHPDHWQALAQVRAGLDVPAAAGVNDAEGIDAPTDRTLSDGEVLTVGDLTFDLIELVGHTPGSIALALRPEFDGAPVHLFTGDCLFPGGVGKTWQPGDFDRLYADVTTKLFDRFDDDTVVHPGHGKGTTLGAERPHLAEWRERGW
ncbi:MBL fold metallo-hydrolase [Tsukamurella asaccharolytica]|uniref:MBL fold metallo-hydrolase n=2 Tax=Tsukamurella asaccharolytica TaxID=2592067 RepID=A0A5C5R604_9ACTN|nr:MBL fold metallo-hydrolase [Tsukamurella asaccharolytica]TWS18479.1 MBL fold metallo-hydrolase [Tsukamurella asaccharolytica]